MQEIKGFEASFFKNYFFFLTGCWTFLWIRFVQSHWIWSKLWNFVIRFIFLDEWNRKKIILKMQVKSELDNNLTSLSPSILLS